MTGHIDMTQHEQQLTAKKVATRGSIFSKNTSGATSAPVFEIKIQRDGANPLRRTSMKRLALISAALLLCIACDNGYTDNEDSCGQGESVDIEANIYCVYEQGIIEEGFRCPEGLPVQHNFEDFVACSEREGLPDGFEEEVQSRTGYGQPPSEGMNPDNPLPDSNDTPACDDGIDRGDGGRLCYSVPGGEDTFIPDCSLDRDLWRVFSQRDTTAYIIPRPDALGLEFGICEGDDQTLADIFERNGLCEEIADPSVVNAMSVQDAVVIASTLHARLVFERRDSNTIFPYPTPDIQLDVCASSSSAEVLSEYCEALNRNCQGGSEPFIGFTAEEADAMISALNALFGNE